MMTEFPETRASILALVRTPENQQAWEAFVATYRPVIYRMARRHGLQDADAQDVAQNILVRISGAINHYEQQEGVKFRHWLSRVAKNAILSAITRSPQDAGAGGTKMVDLLAEHPEQESAVTGEFELEVMREYYLQAAAVVRMEVNQETWQAFELTVIEGLPCEEAAKVIGKSIGTIYAARSRIIKRLRQQIERLQYDNSTVNY
jgi:RNA polymerase sigma-70 factor, ECF subfamily